MKENENKQKDITIFKGCQIVSTLGCFFVLTILVLFLYLFISNTSNILGKSISFLNDDIALKEIDYSKSSEEIKENIDNQIKKIGKNEVLITEDELNILARERFKELEDLKIDIKNGYMIFYWKAFSKDNHSLYAIARIKSEEQDNLYIDRLGSNRFYFPKPLNQIISGVAFNGLEFFKGKSNKLIYEILDSDKDYSIRNIEFKNNNLQLIVDVDIKLFSDD